MRLKTPISALAKARSKLARHVPVGSSALSRLPEWEQNPGELIAYQYVPPAAQGPLPLVVVLHGCTQNARGYDQGSGWSHLAERHGFALLFPEQQRSNNPNLCFNWYVPGDAQRSKGEAASIVGAIDAMRRAHSIDASRIYVTGLSAGGAMASVMLATYPELFAGGAIIAGLPYGCADNLGEAFECMSGRNSAAGAALGASVRRASPHQGPWPRISVWHGSDDRTVAPSNAAAIVRQWTAVHGLGERPDRTETVDGYPRRTWIGRGGEELIEEFIVTGMAHGTPLMPGTDEGQSGSAMAHMLDVGLSSTDRIAGFFGIAPQPAAAAAKAGAARPSEPRARKAAPARPALIAKQPQAQAQPAAGGVQKVIEDALRSAGLMR
jgi:poly(hydroxyalkanoate) depolymerase family esterase